MRTKENFILLIISIVLLALFILIASLVYTYGGNLLIDNSIRDFFYSIRGEKYGFIYWIFRILTEFGYIYFIVLGLIATLIYTKLDYRWCLLFIGVVLTTLINRSIKDVFSRQRPEEAMWWMEESSNSFPSGHATSAGFIYPFIAFSFYKSKYSMKVKNISYAICSALLTIVMISRLVLGVHYFTDVLAGAISGAFISVLLMIASNYCSINGILTLGILDKNKDNGN